MHGFGQKAVAVDSTRPYRAHVGNILMTAAPAPDAETVVPAAVDLRAIDEGDLEAVGHAYWQTYLSTPEEMSLRAAIDDVRAAWDGDYGRWLPDGCVSAWSDGGLVGAIITVEDAPWPDVPRGPFVVDLFVRPDQRRRGIGRALVRTVQARLRTAISLRVDETAGPARRLYASVGFRTPTRDEPAF
jgi:ribosomal protein S18 acetylase RimI-like enzyme